MSNSKKYLLLTLALSLASLGLFALKNSLNLWLPSVQKPSRLSMADPSNITITASKKSAAGVEADTAFLLSSLEPLDSQKLTQSLKIVPALDFKVNQKTDKEYEIIPAAPLEEAKIYRLTLSSLVGGVEARDHSWAFQVKSPLSIVGSYPGNESTHIPTNASVEVYFNTPEVGNDLSKYFEITPKVDGRFEKHQNSLVFPLRLYIPLPLRPGYLFPITLKN